MTISTATPMNQKMTPVNESHSMRICNNKNYIRTSHVFGCSLSSSIERGHYPPRVCTGVSRHLQLLGSLAVHVGRSILTAGNRDPVVMSNGCRPLKKRKGKNLRESGYRPTRWIVPQRQAANVPRQKRHLQQTERSTNRDQDEQHV